jgi:predicted nucleic acid-binding protein
VLLRTELTSQEAEVAFAKLQALPIEDTSLPGLRQRAWEIAKDFGFTTVYDATYLAVAELRGCEFWTADERLFNRVKDRLSFVKWLGDYRRQRST